MAKLSNSPRQTLSLELERRKSFSFSIRVLHDDGVPVNVSGFKFRFVMKDSEYDEDLFDVNNMVTNSEGALSDPSSGLVLFTLQAADLSHDAGNYFYTIVAEDDDGYTSVLLRGEVTLLANTESRSVYSRFSGEISEAGVSVKLRTGDVVQVYTGASSRLVAEAYIIGQGDPTILGSLQPGDLEEVEAARIGQLFISTNLNKAWRKRLDGSWSLVEGGQVSWDDISGKPSGFPPAAHAHTWAQITGKPTAFPPSAHSHPWGQITGKPSTFPPSPHNHSFMSLTGLPETFPATLPLQPGVLSSSADGRLLMDGGPYFDVQNLNNTEELSLNYSGLGFRTGSESLWFTPAGLSRNSGAARYFWPEAGGDHTLATDTWVGDNFLRKNTTPSAMLMASGDSSSTIHYRPDRITLAKTVGGARRSTWIEPNSISMFNWDPAPGSNSLILSSGTIDDRNSIHFRVDPLGVWSNYLPRVSWPPNIGQGVEQTFATREWVQSVGVDVSWSNLSGKPATFPPSAHTHTWAQVTGKPNLFTPAPHNHPWTEITGKPTEFFPALVNSNYFVPYQDGDFWTAFRGHLGWQFHGPAGMSIMTDESVRVVSPSSGESQLNPGYLSVLDNNSNFLNLTPTQFINSPAPGAKRLNLPWWTDGGTNQKTLATEEWVQDELEDVELIVVSPTPPADTDVIWINPDEPSGSGWTIVGAGRPDIPATLDPDAAAQVAAATSGAEFRSLDGPQGAWVWRKRGAEWVCVEGDTGWVTMAVSVTSATGSIRMRRTAYDVEYLFPASGGLTVSGSGATIPIPLGFRARQEQFALWMVDAYRLMSMTGPSLVLWGSASGIARCVAAKTAAASQWPTTLTF